MIPAPDIAPEARHARMIAAAVRLAEQGFALIGWADRADGKAPRRRWKADATDDPALVPGLLRGARNAIVIPKGSAAIIDIDRSVAWQELAVAGLPRTLIIDSATPGHGHVYGWVPEGVDMSTIPGTFAGGEIRRHDPRTGTAGMVLGPWAVRADGIYTPRGDGSTIATLPASVIAYLVQSARHHEATRATARGPGDLGWTITSGRHDFLVARGRHLRGVGVSGPRLVDELVRIDRQHCSPPIAEVRGRGVDEIHRIAAWVDQAIDDDPPSIRPIDERDAGHRPIRLWTAAELGDSLPNVGPDWIARPGLLAIGSITELDGKIKKAGKTTLALHIVRATLDGKPFLGHPTRKARVVYVTEQSRHTFLDALCLVGLDKRGEELRIIFREDIGSTPWVDVVAATRVDGYEVVVFDTIGKLARVKDENSAAEWSAAMSPVQDLAAADSAVLICRHDRKGGGDVGESGRGSSQLSGDADIILALRRPEGNQASNRRVLEGLSRYRETPERLVIELTSEGYALMGETEAVAAADARDFLLRTLVSEFEEKGIAEAGKPLGHTKATVGRELRALVAAGKVGRVGAGGKGDPYRYQVLPQTQAIRFEEKEEADPELDYAKVLAAAESIFGPHTDMGGE